MGHGASVPSSPLKEFKDAMTNADHSAFPEVFKTIMADIEKAEADGVAEATILENAHRAFEAARLSVTIDTAYSSDTGHGKLCIAVHEAPAAAAPRAEASSAPPTPKARAILGRQATEVSLKLLEATTQTIVCLTDGFRRRRRNLAARPSRLISSPRRRRGAAGVATASSRASPSGPGDVRPQVRRGA